MFQNSRIRKHRSPCRLQEEHRFSYQGPLKASRSAERFQRQKSPVGNIRSEYEYEIPEAEEKARANHFDSRIQTFMNQFINPKLMLQAMLTPPIHTQNIQQFTISEEQTKRQIQTLEDKCKGIRQQTIQVQKMVQIKNRLHQKLDALHQEREKIESEAKGARNSSHTMNINQERSDELKFWIQKVREFIKKLNIENLKLEEALRHKSIKEEQARIWQTMPRREEEWGRLQTMLNRFERKQQDSWRRVDEQEFGISRRNLQARSNKPYTRSYMR